MYGLTLREILIIKAFLLSRVNTYMKIIEGFSDENGHGIGELCILHDLLGSSFVDFGDLAGTEIGQELSEEARKLIQSNGVIANKIALAILKKGLDSHEE